MLNDLTYGATLTACLVALVATVWMEATSPSGPTAAAAAHAKAATAQPAKDRDKDCAALVAAAATTDR